MHTWVSFESAQPLCVGVKDQDADSAAGEALPVLQVLVGRCEFLEPGGLCSGNKVAKVKADQPRS